MAGEFDLIARYFDWPAQSSSVALGIGDDAALTNLSLNHSLVVSVDTLVSGVHYPVDSNIEDVAYKALAVNISDIAAMGAESKWFTLALTLPEYDEAWLQSFSKGLKAAAAEYGVDLIGGDTTRGPQTLSIQIMGEVASGKALKRSTAKAGDVLFTTSTLGDGAAGLAVHFNSDDLLVQSPVKTDKAQSEAREYCLSQLNRPTARLVESRVIRNYANACIDVSDGLLQDLSHILKASQLGAELNTDEIPLSDQSKLLFGHEKALAYALSGGDDYELLFSVPQALCEKLQAEMTAHGLPCHRIGQLNAQTGIIKDQHGHPLTASGFQHF
ncbi:thiamine-phosphate kinase [Leucothrix arctica]|uniref:Thiamine-monophosphate kinase n=1 Tax=Leucothrix arctica TaxID=1481894 RepID=A0A317CCS2_9GAMM|nr:thiamine-phosphate kinase [Leucothrix arctica]PWQ93892.1 thiamine-phosphate kinase [Leucothrix arctica]